MKALNRNAPRAYVCARCQRTPTKLPGDILEMEGWWLYPSGKVLCGNCVEEDGE